MTDLPLLSVEHLSKKYCRSFRRSLWYGLRDITGELLPTGHRSEAPGLRPAEFWGLRDVSFELRRGESLAIVGANGAGKSTLLKVLNGLIKPDAGQVRVRGRVGALIELGIGLDPLLSGRENIYVRAALLGLSRRQIAPLIEPIADFSGLGDAIDMPTQFYSSGMASRLAFAVAAHLNPDILLVDEVLAVGDLAFQRKCIQHMLGYLAAGGSIVLVSHAPHHIQSVCQRGLLLEKGQITFAGSAIETLDQYFEQQVALLPGKGNQPDLSTDPDRPIAIVGAVMEATGGQLPTTGTEATVTLTYRAVAPVDRVNWLFSIWTSDGMTCVTGSISSQPVRLYPGTHTLRCSLPQLPLTAGEYGMKAALVDVDSRYPIAQIGWENAPVRVRVHSPVSAQKNMQFMLQQLVTLDVVWNT